MNWLLEGLSDAEIFILMLLALLALMEIAIAFLHGADDGDDD